MLPLICLFFRANFEFYICSRKIGSQRFLPRKKASALSLRARRTHLLRRVCRIFFGSKIASANFSAAIRKLEIGSIKTRFRIKFGMTSQLIAVELESFPFPGGYALLNSADGLLLWFRRALPCPCTFCRNFLYLHTIQKVWNNNFFL